MHGVVWTTRVEALVEVVYDDASAHQPQLVININIVTGALVTTMANKI